MSASGSREEVRRRTHEMPSARLAAVEASVRGEAHGPNAHPLFITRFRKRFQVDSTRERPANSSRVRV